MKVHVSGDAKIPKLIFFMRYIEKSVNAISDEKVINLCL